MRTAAAAAAAALVAALLVPAAAHAGPRTTAITVAGLVGVAEDDDSFDSFDSPSDEVTGVSAQLTWEAAPLALPAQPGYAFGFALAPEVHLGTLSIDDRADVFLAAGVRAELQLSQREQGLLRLSGRTSAFIAARAGVVGDDRAPLYQLVLGTHASFGESRLRLGFEGGLLMFDRGGAARDGAARDGALLAVTLGLR